ncbi:magnesium/cobalt transporter CorA [Sulfurospirillum barnesii]|uniref:Magnesium transport protein CorA n=1 Tax=Sulfurospirillum barnesii (strain ATCC 700032 / DSM 10660 / SES-3) TaxID=760154 RepID=I3XYC0_SULBS|nr:magnesium/cobalt transporter CorA [Sulfurospirillum barnesii]AFL68944.1 magnesium Mg(2+) and cobalt Co(2+) transport protein CorA [Sulfurospirillum barnesii SES-3]
MIRCFFRNSNKLEVITDFNDFYEDEDKKDKVVWLDMLLPTHAEISFVEETFGIDFPTKQESEEIETSSRYWEEDKKIEINSFFLISNEEGAHNETVSFILQGNLLISIRYKELRAFEEFSKRFFYAPREFKNGYYIFSQLLDIRIDADADIIEKLSKDITRLRKHVFTDYANDDEEILEKISALEDLNMNIRENLTDKQRILTSFLKSTKYDDSSLRGDIVIMLKDIKSLIDYTEFNFERLDYLQNIFIGVLSIEQNKVIKIFTIVNVIFLPPTLIASIYGMNFKIMPELDWSYGYAFSLALMVISAITPIAIFKKKGWI